MKTHLISVIFLVSLALGSCSPSQAAIEDTPALAPEEKNIVSLVTPDMTATTATEVAAPVATSPISATDEWKTHHNLQAGFSADYPANWMVDESAGMNGELITSFMAPNKGQGIVVSILTADAAIEEVPDMPNTRCQQVTISGLAGRRCFDTVASNTSTTFLDNGKQYAITTFGKHLDQNIYQHFLENFTLTP